MMLFDISPHKLLNRRSTCIVVYVFAQNYSALLLMRSALLSKLGDERDTAQPQWKTS